MVKRAGHFLCFWFVVSDLLSTALAWVLAYHVRFESGWFPLTKAQPDFDLCWLRIPVVLLLATIAYRAAGQYDIHRLRRFREEVVSVCKGVGLMVLLVIATTFTTQDPYESRGTLFLFGLFTGALILISRRQAWATVRWLRQRGFNQSFAIIVGTGRVARHIARSLRHNRWLGLRVVGFVEQNPTRWTSDLDILGTPGDLPQLVKKYQVEHVFIALPMSRYHEARKVFDILSQTLVDVRLVADVPEMASLSLTTTILDGMPIVGLRESPHFGLNIVIKRTMDIVLSALALVLLAPVMIGIAIAIKLTSQGPIFFAQERCGLNGKTFKMLKFRSMRVDAEALTGPVWASKDDPRRTKLGTFLRKTSLDELPQFINVLLGDMSLVGPRPERPEFIQKFSKTIPNYMARHCVKAGITGWAQVHGWRGNTSLRKRIQYDLHYITHWTPWLDIRILWMTLFHGLVNRNAY